MSPSAPLSPEQQLTGTSPDSPTLTHILSLAESLFPTKPRAANTKQVTSSMFRASLGANGWSWVVLGEHSPGSRTQAAAAESPIVCVAHGHLPA